MNNDAIAKFVDSKESRSATCTRIDFKKREPVYGFFVAFKDYEYLRSKNLWRIVLQSNLEKWEQTGDINYAKIFNGSDITKLSPGERRSS